MSPTDTSSRVAVTERREQYEMLRDAAMVASATAAAECERHSEWARYYDGKVAEADIRDRVETGIS